MRALVKVKGGQEESGAAIDEPIGGIDTSKPIKAHHREAWL